MHLSLFGRLQLDQFRLDTAGDGAFLERDGKGVALSRHLTDFKSSKND
jgi:hypothetical protein